jgi:hypothetical protein
MVLIVLAAAGLLRRPGPSAVGHVRVTTQRRYGADPFQEAVPVTEHVWPAALPENAPNYVTVHAHVDYVSEMANRRIWTTDTGGRYSDSQP